MKERLDRLDECLWFQLLVTAFAFATPFVVGFLLWAIPVKAAEPEDSILAYMEVVAEDYGICPEFIQAIIERESGWDPEAVNGDCVGLMQISEHWHRNRMEQLGTVDLTDPRDNILVGVDYLAELFDKYEDPGMVLLVYNGDSRAKTYWETGELSDYAIDILERSAELERRNGK